MEWLFSRQTVIALAVIGAAASVLAALLRARGYIGEGRARQIDAAGYGFMAASMFAFIVAGFRS
jgi:hypothetical protein